MMLRRCVSELASTRSVAARRRGLTAQVSSLSSRNFSNASRPTLSKGPTSTEETPRSGKYVSKVVLGSIFVGAAATAAYQTGYFNVKNEKSSVNSSILDAQKETEHLDHSVDEVILPGNDRPSKSKPEIETVDKNGQPDTSEEPQDFNNLEVSKEVGSEVTPSAEEPISVPIKEKNPSEEEPIPVPIKEKNPSEEEPIPVPIKENDSTSFPQEITLNPAEQTIDPASLPNDTSNIDYISKTETNMEPNKMIETSTSQNDKSDYSISVSEESGIIKPVTDQSSSIDILKESLDNDANASIPLAQSYSLQVDETPPEVSGKGETADAYATFSKDEKASAFTRGNSKDVNESRDGKIVLDLIEAIDIARRKQAESDAYIFAEEKRMLKEKYEKELKDARARELMYAEEAAILDKEFNKEKAKAAAAIRQTQEKAEQKLREELERKEEEAAIQLKKVQELAKAELAAAIAKEKSSQIEKFAEADLHINALCMAFYARSEEARQTHSIHKLALGTLVLEDALSRGMPIRTVVDALHKSLDGIDRDSLLDLTLSSLPEETLDYGTSTQMKLNQEFDSLKGSLRHFSIIPAGGGGILSHIVAHLASSIKVKEDQSGEGVESLISKVQSFLGEGKIAEAADALEEGVHGSEAEQLVAGWVSQARNRAVVEQAHSLLQSYATSVTFA